MSYRGHHHLKRVNLPTERQKPDTPSLIHWVSVIALFPFRFLMREALALLLLTLLAYLAFYMYMQGTKERQEQYHQIMDAAAQVPIVLGGLAYQGGMPQLGEMLGYKPSASNAEQARKLLQMLSGKPDVSKIRELAGKETKEGESPAATPESAATPATTKNTPPAVIPENTPASSAPETPDDTEEVEEASPPPLSPPPAPAQPPAPKEIRPVTAAPAQPISQPSPAPQPKAEVPALQPAPVPARAFPPVKIPAITLAATAIHAPAPAPAIPAPKPVATPVPQPAPAIPASQLPPAAERTPKSLEPILTALSAAKNFDAIKSRLTVEYVGESGAGAIPFLVKLLEHDATGTLRAPALETLHRIDTPEAWVVLHNYEPAPTSAPAPEAAAPPPAEAPAQPSPPPQRPVAW